MKKILVPFKWIWYYLLEPRALKPSEMKKNVDKGYNTTQDSLYETTGDLIQKKAKRRKN